MRNSRCSRATFLRTRNCRPVAKVFGIGRPSKVRPDRSWPIPWPDWTTGPWIYSANASCPGIARPWWSVCERPAGRRKPNAAALSATVKTLDEPALLSPFHNQGAEFLADYPAGESGAGAQTGRDPPPFARGRGAVPRAARSADRGVGPAAGRRGPGVRHGVEKCGEAILDADRCRKRKLGGRSRNKWSS